MTTLQKKAGEHHCFLKASRDKLMSNPRHQSTQKELLACSWAAPRVLDQSRWIASRTCCNVMSTARLAMERAGYSSREHRARQIQPRRVTRRWVQSRRAPSVGWFGHLVRSSARRTCLQSGTGIPETASQKRRNHSMAGETAVQKRRAWEIVSTSPVARQGRWSQKSRVGGSEPGMLGKGGPRT